MADVGIMSMGRFSQPRGARPRDRLRDFLHARGYRGRPSDLAEQLNLPLKSAENLLNGHWPADDLKLAAIFSRFGRDLYDAVFAPDVDAVLAQLHKEEEALARKLREIQHRRLQAQGLGEGGSGVRTPADDETLDLFEGRPAAVAADTTAKHQNAAERASARADG